MDMYDQLSMLINEKETKKLSLTRWDPTGDIRSSLTALEIENEKSGVLLYESPEPEEATSFLVY